MFQVTREICDFALSYKSPDFSFSRVAADGHMRIVGGSCYLFSKIPRRS